MDDLVARLSAGDHPIEVSLRPTKSISAFRERLDDGYIHLLFGSTRGGTELGMEVNRERSDLTGGNFTEGSGSIHVEGDLTLNYQRVRCIADINLATLDGRGRLDPIAD